jgi:hypothetical protein
MKEKSAIQFLPLNTYPACCNGKSVHGCGCGSEWVNNHWDSRTQRRSCTEQDERKKEREIEGVVLTPQLMKKVFSSLSMGSSLETAY